MVSRLTKTRIYQAKKKRAVAMGTNSKGSHRYIVARSNLGEGAAISGSEGS